MFIKYVQGYTYNICYQIYLQDHAKVKITNLAQYIFNHTNQYDAQNLSTLLHIILWNNTCSGPNDTGKEKEKVNNSINSLHIYCTT